MASSNVTDGVSLCQAVKSLGTSAFPNTTPLSAFDIDAHSYSMPFMRIDQVRGQVSVQCFAGLFFAVRDGDNAFLFLCSSPVLSKFCKRAMLPASLLKGVPRRPL